MTVRLIRDPRNPLIAPRGDDWEMMATFNCAALYKDGHVHVLYRAVGDYVTYASRLGYARFDREMTLLERPTRPFFDTAPYLWEASVEDPRLVEIEGAVYLTYVVTPKPTPPGGVRRQFGIPKPETWIPRTAVARVEGLGTLKPRFERLGIITPYRADERDVVLFPDKIQGRYAVLHRPRNWVGPKYQVDRPSIWFAFMDTLPGPMYGHRVVLSPRYVWEGEKVGAGPPPIRTEVGWLLIYHGVDRDWTYRAGVALLDLDAPWRVIARLPDPILEPEMPYEREGDVPNVVFPEGAVVLDDTLYVFYGAADKTCCLAAVDLPGLLETLLAHPVQA